MPHPRDLATRFVRLCAESGGKGKYGLLAGEKRKREQQQLMLPTERVYIGNLPRLCVKTCHDSCCLSRFPQVVRDMFVQNPEQRPSAREVVGRLETILEELPEL